MSGGQRAGRGPGEGNLNMILHSFCCSVEFSNSALLGTEGQRNNLSVEMPHNFFSFIDCCGRASNRLILSPPIVLHQLLKIREFMINIPAVNTSSLKYVAAISGPSEQSSARS